LNGKLIVNNAGELTCRVSEILTNYYIPQRDGTNKKFVDSKMTTFPLTVTKYIYDYQSEICGKHPQSNLVGTAEEEAPLCPSPLE
jgi:hypothetical protein